MEHDVLDTARGQAAEARKTTFRLPADVLDAIRDLVDQNEVESQTAFVEQALRRELAERRRIRLRGAYEEAAADPEFMNETRTSARELDGTVGDGLG